MKPVNLKKNYIYRLTYDLLCLIAPFITTPYVSRVLGADRIGTYSFTSSIITFFVLFAALGTNSYGTREIARHRNNRKEASQIFWEIEILSVITTSVCLIGWMFVILFWEEYRYYFIALIPMLAAVLFDISWLYTGYEEIRYTVACSTIFRILGIVLLFLCVRTRDDILKYVLINSSIQLFGNMALWIYLPRMVDRVDIHSIHLKKHFHETLIYFIPTIAASIYTVLDKTLIGWITHDSYQNGYYEQANKVVNMLKTLTFSSLNLVMQARISYLFAQEKYEEIKEKIHMSMDYIFLVGYGAAFGMAGISKVFVPVFFGEGYDPVIPLLRAMLPLLLIISVSNCLGSQYYTPAGKRKLSAEFIIAGAAANLVMNLLLIPRYGAMGAVVASILAESIITILYMHFCSGYLTIRVLWKLSWDKLIAGAVMMLIVMYAGDHIPLSPILVLVVQVAVGVAAYAGILALLKDRMLAYVWNTLKRKFRHKADRQID